MIWSLIKIVLFVTLVTALTFGATYIIEAGGEVRVAIGSGLPRLRGSNTRW